jgi:hypothetical protein
VELTEERITEAESRLRAWVRDYGDKCKDPVFIEDLQALLYVIERLRTAAELMKKSVKEWNEENPDDKITTPSAR